MLIERKKEVLPHCIIPACRISPKWFSIPSLLPPPKKKKTKKSVPGFLLQPLVIKAAVVAFFMFVVFFFRNFDLIAKLAF